MKRVYICAPDCGNTARDWKQITKYIKYALLCGTAPVVPQVYARCLDVSNPRERQIGVAAGLGLLWFCDEMWIFGNEKTKGMEAELQFCKNLHVKTRKIRESEILKKIGGSSI